MCDYSLHAVATRPAEVGETIVTTTFRGTSTRGFASEADMSVAVCLLPGTELAFADNVRYDNRWIWTRTINSRVGKFGKIDPHIPDRHHDAIEFPDGKYVLVTQLVEGQRATVLQLPVTQPLGEREHKPQIIADRPPTITPPADRLTTPSPAGRSGPGLRCPSPAAAGEMEWFASVEIMSPSRQQVARSLRCLA